MKQVDCKSLKAQGLLELEEKIKAKNIVLKIIQVAGDKASDVYVRNKKKASENIGLQADHLLFEDDIQTEQLIEVIESLNKDDSVHGIMVQLPLPKHIDEYKVINSITPIKDVDGLTNENLGRIVTNNEGLRPCTAEGVLKILDEVIGLDSLKGKKAVIIGRSKLVGLPLFHMLMACDATITMCHTKTENLKEITNEADILITAAGSKEPFIDSSYIKDGSIVIDVSTVRNLETGKLHGDVLYDDAIKKASYVTPVPGGVGQMTVLELMNNTYKAYQLQNKKKQGKTQKTLVKS